MKSFTKTPFFNRALEINSKLDSKLKKDVNKIFYNNNNLLLKLLGMMKQYYTENCTLEEYYYNICYKIGKENKEKGQQIFRNNIEINADNIHKKLNNTYKIENIRSALLMQILLKPYLGFVFEQIIKNTLIANNFVIEQSEILDNTYCIDLLVSYNIEYLKHIKVGLQLKSLSYIEINSRYKQKHQGANNCAIRNNICEEVYYLMHDDNIELISCNDILICKESICNNLITSYLNETINDEELLIKELLKKIYYVYIQQNFDKNFNEFYNEINKSLNQNANSNLSIAMS